jgi:hypothetical protein
MKQIISAIVALALAIFSPGAFAQSIATNALSGSQSATTTAAAQIIPAPGVGFRIYVGAVQCGRTDAGTTAMYVTLNDPAATVIILPNSGGGGGNNPTFIPPLVVAPNTALMFTESTNTSTVFCDAQGFKNR